MSDEREQSLVLAEPRELTEEQEAWAEYWHQTALAKEHWDTNVVTSGAIAGVTLPLSAGLLYLCVPLFGAVAKWLGLLVALGVVVGGIAGFLGIVALLVLLTDGLWNWPWIKRRIPELPENYTEEMGELAWKLRGDIQKHNKQIETAVELPEKYARIEADRECLETYRLAAGTEIETLALPDGLDDL